MTTPEAEPTNPPEGEATASEDQAAAEAKQPSEVPLDPKEEARRRSKEDLARKRRGLRSSRGKR